MKFKKNILPLLHEIIGYYGKSNFIGKGYGWNKLYPFLFLRSNQVSEGCSPGIPLPFLKVNMPALRFVRRDTTNNLWTLRTAHEVGAIPSYLMQVGRTIGNEYQRDLVKTVSKIDAVKKLVSLN